MNYSTYWNPSQQTPQRKPIDKTQVPNHEGGYVWETDAWTRLRRFLILGSEDGSFYQSPKDLTIENAENLKACVEEDGPRVLNLITNLDSANASPRQDALLFGIAVAMSYGDIQTRQLAAKILPQVARTGSHILRFVSYVDDLRGWGDVLKRAVGDWYNRKGDWLAFQVTKYRQRYGWTHGQVLRKAHPVPETSALNRVFEWCVAQERGGAFELTDEDAHFIQGYEAAQAATTPEGWVRVIQDYGLHREHLPTEALQYPEVWDAMLQSGMPIGAAIRNLGVMTANGLIAPFAEATGLIVDLLSDAEALRKARVHPFHVLYALTTYMAGKGARGRLSWTPNPQVLDALDGAFYTSYGAIEPAGKRFLLAVDVSPSMFGNKMFGTHIDAATAAAAMCLITANTEPQHHVVTFNHEMTRLNFSPRQRLDDVVRSMDDAPWGGTDCAAPIIWATERNIEVDIIVEYSDYETWAGDIHVMRALEEYRRQVNPNARLATVNFVANNLRLSRRGDIEDKGSMEFVGFDATAARVLSDFAAGRV